jgi:hypothetical protein
VKGGEGLVSLALQLADEGFEGRPAFSLVENGSATITFAQSEHFDDVVVIEALVVSATSSPRE